MIYKKFSLNSFNKNASKDAYLEIYLHDDEKKRPAILVVPGGGYFSIAPLEGETIALRYMSESFNAFVLSYAINMPYPAPHIDLALATLFIRLQENDYNLDGKLFILGCSAGAHLAGSFGYLYPQLASILDVNPDVLLPTGLILCYPVISFLTNAHEPSRDILTNKNPALYEQFSIEKNITPSYPPTFLWTTLADKGVDPNNTRLMENALKNAGVTYECYYFEGDLNHGQSNVSIENRGKFVPYTKDELNCKSWVDKSLNFISKNFY